jgi:uncharacterized membrane protein
MSGLTLQITLAGAATLGSALVAGFFYAFSVCVMRAFKALPYKQGIAAMQSINIVVINPWFLSAFFGVALLCLFAIAWAVLNWSAPRSEYMLLGGCVYLIGTIGVTMRLNVPMNQALAALDAGSPYAEQFWANYLKVWTRWNHVRTLAALLASVLFYIK